MASRSTETAFPVRFNSLQHMVDFVRNADVTYLVDDCRWEVITLNAEENIVTLLGDYNGVEDGEFEIRILYANNVLHCTVTSLIQYPDVVDFVVDHFLPAFFRFPASY
jgi:hypothetical protein